MWILNSLIDDYDRNSKITNKRGNNYRHASFFHNTDESIHTDSVCNITNENNNDCNH